MPKYNSFNEAAHCNSRRLCKVSGCTNHRWKISGYCEPHSRKVQRFGHPLGGDIPKSYLTESSLQVVRLFEINPDHAGKRMAEKFYDKWLTMASVSVDMSSPVVPVARHLARLGNHNITPLECLISSATVYVYSYKDRSGFIKSDTHLKALLGQKLFALAPMGSARQKTGPERKAAGRYIMQHIGPFLVTCADAVKQMEQQEQNRLKALGAKFQLPPTK